ncbi:hypothetical protein [Roseibium sp. RKSG952]|uniref:hypothetical protein n=1 Tax=Roseibium sp. RKSG952 TaxID=2529384 RepID=UPI0012BCFF4E|nr:hypothetical protein [Roseibium sp. RKSG952]MTH95137.1 hypothetical protein [Roseibium sp. RKSG952]
MQTRTDELLQRAIHRPGPAINSAGNGGKDEPQEPKRLSGKDGKRKADPAGGGKRTLKQAFDDLPAAEKLNLLAALRSILGRR